MSKRLQVILSDIEYKQVQSFANKQGASVSKLVRDSIIRFISQSTSKKPEARIASLMRYARFSGPTGDIEDILSQIEKGRE